MNHRHLLVAAAAVGALALAAPSQSAPNRAGAQKAGAKTSISRGPAGGGNHGGGHHAAQRGGGGKQLSNQQAYKAGKAAGGRNQRDVVVVGNPGRGYYDNGRYHNNGDWDDNDNDFLEFVGKTAAITAGVSVVTAVIGDVVKDKPADCQPITVGGQPYLNCNGVAYQQVPGGYQVVAPPS
jgi:hypothetical protein